MFGHLQTEKFNGVDFDSFSKNLVYKHETNIEFEGYKHYLNGIDVVERLECQELNTIPLENILRKTGTQKVKGPLEIRGNVFVNSNTDISETLNNIPIEDLKNMFETIDGGYKINGILCAELETVTLYGFAFRGRVFQPVNENPVIQYDIRRWCSRF